MKRNVLIAAAAALSLAGCAGAPEIVARTPGNIVLDYFEGGEQAAFTAAQEHCAAQGRTAYAGTEWRGQGFSGVGRRMTFACR